MESAQTIKFVQNLITVTTDLHVFYKEVNWNAGLIFRLAWFVKTVFTAIPAL